MVWGHLQPDPLLIIDIFRDFMFEHQEDSFGQVRHYVQHENYQDVCYVYWGILKDAAFDDTDENERWD